MTVDEQLECGLRARLDAAGTEAQAEIVWPLEVALDVAPESARAGAHTREMRTPRRLVARRMRTVSHNGEFLFTASNNMSKESFQDSSQSVDTPIFTWGLLVHSWRHSITFNLCKHYRDGSRSDTTVPPLLRYDSLPDGSYAVGRRRALHQHRSVHALLHLPGRTVSRHW